MSSVHAAALRSDQLENYLLSLTPAAARFLIREVELDRLRGGNAFEHELILKHARRAIQHQGSHFDRVGTPLRLLCEPFADMLVDNTTAKKQVGRISRSSILPMWRWLTEDVAPDVFHDLDQQISKALLDEDHDRVTTLTGALHTAAAESIRTALAGIQPDTRAYFQVASVLGSPRIVEDVLDMAEYLERAPLLMRIRSRLPAHLESLTRDEVTRAVSLHNRLASTAPDDAYLLPLVLTSRLRRPSEILRIITVIARSEFDSDIRATPLAVVCECLLHDMEVAALGALEAINSRAPVEIIRSFLAHFFEIAEGFVGLVDVDMKGPWGQRIVSIRSALSSNIRIALDAAPRLIKSALYGRRRRPLGSHGVPTVRRPDPRAVEEAAYVVRLMLVVRPFLSQIPINAEFASLQSTVISFIESVGEITIEDIRHGRGEARAAAEEYLAAIADINELVFGRENADLLRRRARAAVQLHTGT